MYRIGLVILCMMFGLQGRAEYGSLIIEMKITEVTGKISTGYVELATAYFHADSLQYPDYATRVIPSMAMQEEGRMGYFGNQINYTYPDQYRDMHNVTVPVMVDFTQVEIAGIHSIEVLDTRESTYMFQAFGPSTISDTIWTDTPILDTLSTGGILNSFQIFIHEESKEITALKEALYSIETEFTTQCEAHRETMENADGEPYYEAEEALKKLEDEIDRKIGDLVAQFTEHKVVIIAFYSC